MEYMFKGHNGVGRGPVRTSLIPKLVEWPVVPVQIDTPTADDELFEERSAIREFDGGLSRDDAEILARHDTTDGRGEFAYMSQPPQNRPAGKPQPNPHFYEIENEPTRKTPN